MEATRVIRKLCMFKKLREFNIQAKVDPNIWTCVNKSKNKYDNIWIGLALEASFTQIGMT